MPPIPQPDLQEILTATTHLWPTIANQHLFLTGGTGFFGTWLTESFLQANRKLNLNAHLTILTRNPAAFQAKAPHLTQNPALTLLKGDIRTFPFPPGPYRYVLHAATEASAHLTASAPDLQHQTIVEGTRHTLAFAAQAGTTKLLYLSSGAVYGPQAGPQATEDTPLNPQDAYARGKAQAEALCTQSPLNTTIARPFAFHGPHLPLHTHFALGNLLADHLTHRPLQIRGDGTALRSYLYATDLTVALWHLLLSPRATPGPYNLGSEHPISIADLARTISPQGPIEIHGKAGPLHRYVPSTQRLQQDLGLHQTVSLQEGLRRTIQWLRLE